MSDPVSNLIIISLREEIGIGEVREEVGMRGLMFQTKNSARYLVVGLTLVLFAVGCHQAPLEKNVKVSQKKEGLTLQDGSLEPFQQELLDLAFATASAIPKNPHIKDRSKTQEKIVEICLELDQPQRVLKSIPKIENWRRGSCYADLALYCAKNGDTDPIHEYLNQAEKCAEETEDWRRDQIRVKIARVHAWQGHSEKADAFQSGVVDSETGKVAKVDAMKSDESDFDEQIKNLDALIATEKFDVVKNALEAYVALYDRFFDNVEKCAFLEDKIKSSWDGMPIFIRIERLFDMTESALNHSDHEKALELVQEAQKHLDGYQWKLEHRLPMSAKLVQLRYRAGEKEKAKDDAEAEWELFKQKGKTIVNIWQANALRPLAETFQKIGETELALTVYKQVVEVGVDNPNSRPRAEDLAATCGSLALCGLQPDEDLWNRIRQIYEELGQPW